MSKYFGFFIALPLAAVPMVLELITTDEADRHEDFWVYNLCGTLVNSLFFAQNVSFLVVAFNNANR